MIVASIIGKKKKSKPASGSRPYQQRCAQSSSASAELFECGLN